MRNVYTILRRISKGKDRISRPRGRWKDIIKIDLKKEDVKKWD
jgi:hypothetical protein